MTSPPGSRRRHAWGGVVLGTLLGVFAGCGDSALSTSPPSGTTNAAGTTGTGGSGGTAGAPAYAGSGGTSPNGSDPGVPSVGAKVWTSDGAKVVAQAFDGGGSAGAFGSSPPCADGRTYTLTVADRKLSWYLCDARAADPTTALVTGERVLSAVELAGVIEALEHVTVSGEEGCGYDGTIFELTLTTPVGEQKYEDDFHCGLGGTRATNLGEVVAAFQPLAK